MTVKNDFVLPQVVTDPFKLALIKIARGRNDCGRPLAAQISREIARRVLLENGLKW